MKKKWTIIVSVILCVALMFYGCGKKKEQVTFTGDTTEEPAYQGNLNAISPSAYKNVKGLGLEPGTYISIIGKDNSTSYWKELKRGIDQAAADLNKELGYSGEDKIKVTYNAPGAAEDIDEQVNILDEELARYPDALGIASIDADACKVQFDLATENGIPIVAFDSGNTYQGIQCTIKTENMEAAKTGAYKLCDEIGGKGDVLLLVHDSKSATGKEREAGFKSEIQDNRPEVNVVETLYLNNMDEMKKKIVEEREQNKEQDEQAETTQEPVDAEKEMAEKQNAIAAMTEEDVIAYYLEKHPQVKGVFGTNVKATQLALSSLKQSVRLDNTVLVGFDAGKEQLEALKNGEIYGLVVQNPFGIGYASVVAASRTVLESGNEAEVTTGYLWVTEENLKDEVIQNMLYE